MAKQLYDQIDKSILKGIPNPSSGAYEVKIKVPELTFLAPSSLPPIMFPEELICYESYF